MWKIVVVLLLTALAILTARLVSDAPFIETRTGAITLEAGTLQTPPLMYAGVRG
ncbi:MAG: hypothetical protein ACRECX_15205 [Methyloceanibacter sp.]|uniref:hypothetical protein n=1 Tax=Methyloceanibacter sp. TaxID=1965321 RepID=UPI003D6C9FFF